MLAADGLEPATVHLPTGARASGRHLLMVSQEANLCRKWPLTLAWPQWCFSCYLTVSTTTSHPAQTQKGGCRLAVEGKRLGHRGFGRCSRFDQWESSKTSSLFKDVRRRWCKWRNSLKTVGEWQLCLPSELIQCSLPTPSNCSRKREIHSIKWVDILSGIHGFRNKESVCGNWLNMCV